MSVPGDREINTTGVDRCKPVGNVCLNCWEVFLKGALILLGFFFHFSFVFCSVWYFDVNLHSKQMFKIVKRCQYFTMNKAGYYYQTLRLTLPDVSWFGNALHDMTELYRRRPPWREYTSRDRAEMTG